MEQPVKDKYNKVVPSFYVGYYRESGAGEIIDILKIQQKDTYQFVLSIPSSKLHFAYADGKWTVSEVLLHLIDVERLFAARALRFARNDNAPLPGFDENKYVPYSNAVNRTLQSLADEYQAVREATVQLFLNFNDEMKSRTGFASGVEISVETIGRTIPGHEIHHKRVIIERYL